MCRGLCGCLAWKHLLVMGYGSPGGSMLKNPAANAGTILDWEDPLEKEMATLSSILAWKILWTEEFGRLYPSVQSSSVQLLGHVRLCDPVDCSMTGLPVYHQLLEFAQTHVH